MYTQTSSSSGTRAKFLPQNISDCSYWIYQILWSWSIHPLKIRRVLIAKKHGTTAPLMSLNQMLAVNYSIAGAALAQMLCFENLLLDSWSFTPRFRAFKLLRQPWTDVSWCTKMVQNAWNAAKIEHHETSQVNQVMMRQYTNIALVNCTW